MQELTLLINMHIRLEEEEEDDGDLSKYDLWGSADADADDNQGIYNIHSILQLTNTLYNMHLYIRNLKYSHLTPVFRQHNIHLVFSTYQHKYKWIGTYCVLQNKFQTRIFKIYDVQILIII